MGVVWVEFRTTSIIFLQDQIKASAERNWGPELADVYNIMFDSITQCTCNNNVVYLSIQSKLADISRDFKGVLELRTEVGYYECFINPCPHCMDICTLAKQVNCPLYINFVHVHVRTELETAKATARTVFSITSHLSAKFIRRR